MDTTVPLDAHGNPLLAGDGNSSIDGFLELTETTRLTTRTSEDVEQVKKLFEVKGHQFLTLFSLQESSTELLFSAGYDGEEEQVINMPVSADHGERARPGTV